MLFDGMLSIITSPFTLMLCLLGVLIGTLVGALPGVGSVTAMAILLPITFSFSPFDALTLLISIYLGGQYGGRISSILINVPGDAGAVVTTFDGYPMSQQGETGKALMLSAVASFIGSYIGFFGIVFLIISIDKLIIYLCTDTYL